MKITETRRLRLKEWFSSRSIPASEKSYISQLINGKASFGEKAARRLEETYGMNPGYLDDRESSRELEEPRAIYGTNPNPNLAVVTRKARGLNIVKLHDVDTYLGGDMAVVISTILTTEEDPNAFVIQLDEADDSMENEFPPGTLVVIKPSQSARSGQYVLARNPDTNALTFKQYFVDAGQSFLKPLNPRYKISEAQNAEIVGVAVQQLTIKNYS